jgi:hypothetical protein
LLLEKGFLLELFLRLDREKSGMRNARVPLPNPRRRPAHRGPWLGLVVLAALAGCGEDENPDIGTCYPVKGKVVLRDGKPLTSGEVEFTATKGSLAVATGKLGPDGSFTLSTRGKEGAPATEYRIRIIPDPSAILYTTKGTMKIPDYRKLPYSPKYLDDQSSELVVTVKPEPNELPPFTLSNEPAGARSSARERDND